MFRIIHGIAVIVALFTGQIATAQDTSDDAKVQKFIDSLHFQTGTVAIDAAHATLSLTPQFRYLDAQDAQLVLTQLWGNPPGSRALGMLVPTAVPLSDPKNSWAIVISYQDDGHISDADTLTIDYDKMLKDMQEATHEANPERKHQGYGEVELVGWATKPHYDTSTNKLYWAKELAFNDVREHTLNYDIRALGRGGYLSLNAVASLSQLPVIETQMQKVLTMIQFDAGQRYADFSASTDKVAAYGIGALVAGAIAAKAGLFAKLIAMLIVFKKVAIAGFVALAAVLRKLFGGKSKLATLPAPLEDEAS